MEINKAHTQIEQALTLNEECEAGEQAIGTLELTEKAVGDVTDPLNTADDRIDGLQKNKSLSQNKNTLKKSLLDDVVDAIFPRLKKPIGIPFLVDDKESKATEPQEEVEKRLLKHRIISMKNRFLLELEAPEKAQAEKERATAQSRLRREKRKAMETPEDTAARKQRQRMLAAISRKRIKELETPEQRAERMAKDREKSRLRLHKKLAAETPEERAARRQRQKEYELKKRPSCILTMKTGKIRGRTRKEPKNAGGVDRESSLDVNLEVELNKNNADCLL